MSTEKESLIKKFFQFQEVEEKYQHPQGSPTEQIIYINPIDYIFSEDDERRLWEVRAITGWPLPNPIAVSTNSIVRFENYLRQKRKEKDDLIPKKNKFPEGNPNTKREDFGPGKAGVWSYNLIKNGAECTAYLDDEKTECGNISIGTVDVDINSNLDLFPYCSEEHAAILTKQLVTEIESNGDTTTPSRNGFGRELASGGIPMPTYDPQTT